jgi:hypothetical protein
MGRFNRAILIILFLSVLPLCGCNGWIPHDTQSLLIPKFHRSEIIGFVAGLGTTFAGLPTCLQCSSVVQVPA